MPKPKDWTEAYGVFVRRKDGGKPNAATMIDGSLYFSRGEAQENLMDIVECVKALDIAVEYEVRRVFVSVGDVVE